MENLIQEDWITNTQNNLLKHTVEVVYNYLYNERKRKALAALCTILHLKKKRKYRKKKHWVAPLFKERKVHGFYHAILPILRLEDLRFCNYVRMSATQLENLLVLIGHDIYKQSYIRESIGVSERLLLTLRFLASGDSISSMSYQYLVGVTTAANIISETCQVLWDNLLPIVMTMELSHENWYKISECFSNKWNFPHCVGAIDGKHIIIQCPAKAGSSFYNYKSTHSIVLLAICDANYMFLFVDIGAYGRRSDGGIFKESEMGKRFENNDMQLPPLASICENGDSLPYCIVGDEAFPLKPYLLRPYPGKYSVEHDKRIFNYRLGRARRVIENTFGILASRWRIFRKPIILSVENSMKIVQACVCLHNWLRMADLLEEENIQYITEDIIDHEAEDGFALAFRRTELENSTAFREMTNAGNNSSTREAVEIREKFKHYFNNDGAVEWQENNI
ncbi:putative nuclease HARBI1 isoform X1 [Monomorium pharaonis]|uniref:putative nuclease HARBI1 isoform X1 n=1 Tax=Monomorium pharaonis TaxID=307658 RepID=UPI0017469881|nr:putative nuclease HARBI1 isoform X1 [Monomorium pharaonis]